MEDLQAETTRLLQELIRFNTVNPPGNERPAQEHLAAILRDAGFEVRLLGRTEERPNLVARLRGDGDGPTLCLLSHVDTVYATPGEWRHDPWSGDLADGCVAEKGVFRFVLHPEGVAGHASIPKIGDNALLKLAPLLEAMRDRQPEFDITAAPQAMLDGLGVRGLEELRAKDAVLAMLVE